MEREFHSGEQKIRFDRDTTETLYRETITVPGTDRCSCISCKNFAAQRRSIYPDKFLQEMKQLGVEPAVEWEAFDYDFGADSLQNHLYGGWFLFCGELVEGLSRPSELGAGFFAYSFTNSFQAGSLPKD
jgi:hypothetical protein